LENLQKYIDENKPIVVMEGENGLLIRKNGKVDLELIKFRRLSKLLEIMAFSD
jgi:hypothetical protein